jgi:hypothetical protein
MFISLSSFSSRFHVHVLLANITRSSRIHQRNRQTKTNKQRHRYNGSLLLLKKRIHMVRKEEAGSGQGPRVKHENRDVLIRRGEQECAAYRPINNCTPPHRRPVSNCRCAQCLFAWRRRRRAPAPKLRRRHARPRATDRSLIAAIAIAAPAMQTGLRDGSSRRRRDGWQTCEIGRMQTVRQFKIVKTVPSTPAPDLADVLKR